MLWLFTNRKLFVGPRKTASNKQKRPKSYDLDLQLGYKDSNLETTESEFVNYS